MMKSIRLENWIRLFLISLLIFVSGFAYCNSISKAGLTALASDSTCTQVEVPDVGIDQTLEFLLFSEGDPSEIKALSEQDQHLHYYYYACSNSTYIINSETGYICNATIGKFTGSCPP
ncbi:hypothetical protein ACLKMH_24335 [Psychromonas sp. KJ10-10]|uniref:hypothetical protein n=1 Tax=Psychromonas sp. KJ10-10 TaxID=3391823 RepID=UPI0039B5D630